MPPNPSNKAIAETLEELGDLYELDGAVVHRVLAYRNAARSVRESSVSVATLAAAGQATELPGIGATIQEKINALSETGTIPAAERLRAKFPAGLLAITRLPGLGPKRARLLYDQLGIDSLDALRDAALAQRLRTVRGLGPKFEANVLAAIEAGAGDRDPLRLLLPDALELAASLIDGLRQRGPADARLSVAGSARRGGDSVKDVDLIATTAQPEALAGLLADLEQIAAVGSSGTAGARGRTHSGLPVDLRIAAPGQYGNLLQHFTGSALHNAALRERVVRRGLHVSEYGILDDASGKTSECADEQQVYERLGLAYIEPELRENRGEIEAAGAGALPNLVGERDMRGDLHCHTLTSDGRADIHQMASAARERGYEYLAITDHSATHGFGNAVSADELRAQIERIRQANVSLEGIQLLAGSEVNILSDGSLDYGDALLAELDWVIASVHTAFNMTEESMTARMVAAIEHPLVDAIGHPTGRLIERRAPYAVDVEQLIAAAAANSTMLEINGSPRRRDLADPHARAAAEAGVLLVIDSDAHSPTSLANMRWGVETARRAWLSAEHVANTRPWKELAALRKRTPAGSAGGHAAGVRSGRR